MDSKNQENQNQIGDKPREITWRELKEFVNSLSEAELDKKVLTQVSDDDYRKFMNEPFREEEDVWIHDPSEEIATLKELQEIVADEEGFSVSDCRVITPKGTPFLWID